MMTDRPLYPVTIVTTRYGGAYEGGRWAAFHADPGAPCMEGFDGSDPDAFNWWENHRTDTWVAVGETPQQALAALTAKGGWRDW